MVILYLHGFGSSPGSKKATYLREQLAQKGIDLIVPDLNVPDLEHITITAMQEKVAAVLRDEAPSGPVVLVGSSLGGLVALHFADRYREAEGARVQHLFLLAPALDFMENRQQQLGETGLAQWRASGWLPIHNYATDSPSKVHYGLVEDIQKYDSYAVGLDIPITIVHGEHDTSVRVAQSMRYAEGRDNVDLRVVDSDHALLDQQDLIFDTLMSLL